MTSLRTLASRLVDGLRRPQRDARLDEEIETHLDALRDDFVARGYAPGDADAAARRAFGGVDQVKARYREQRGWPWLDALVQDVAFSLRHLWRGRGYTRTVVGVLALGLGVGHMFFTLTYAHTMRGVPIDGVDRVLWVSSLDANGAEHGLSYADFTDLSALQRSFTMLGARIGAPVTLGDDRLAPDRVDATFATSTAFDIATVRPLLGRVITAADDVRGAPPVVVLTERVWRTRYGADAALLGREVFVNGIPTTVVGLVSDRSGFPSGAAVFLPLGAHPDILDAPRDARSLLVFGRLAPLATPADAGADLDAVATELARRFPATNDGARLRALPFNDRLLGLDRWRGGWMSFIIAGLVVLAVACTNVGNLLLAGAADRAREVAVRTALGASRRRLARQLVVECLAMATAAALVGLTLSRAGVAIYRQWIPDGILPYWFDYSLNLPLFLALAAMALVAVVVFAVVPALHATRIAVVEVLKDGGRGDTARRGTRLGASALLAVQLGLAVVLVTHVGLSAVNSGERLETDARLENDAVLTGAVTLPAARYPTVDARRDFHRRMVEHLRGLPGVTGVALTAPGPMEGAPERRLVIEGRDVDATGAIVHAVDIDPGYFSTLGLGAVRGRVLADGDGVNAAAVVLVNQRLAALHFADSDPIGRRIAVMSVGDAGPPQWATVVGVVPDLRQRPGITAAIPIAYRPLAATAPTSTTVLVSTAGDAVALAAPVREALRALDDLVPLHRARSLAAATRDATWAARVSAHLALTVSGAAFLLAAAGLYAVVSHRTSRRQREIGVRMALGADRRRIAALVLRSVGGALATGLVLGLAGVVAWARAFAPRGDATPLRPAMLAAAIAALVLTALAGGLLPMRRASRIAPAEVLRRE